MTDASNWAKQLAERKLQQREAKQAEDEKILSDRRLIKDRGPEMWEKFNKAIVEYLGDLRAAMRGEDSLRMTVDRPGGPARERITLSDAKSGEQLFVATFDGKDGKMHTTFLDYSLVPLGTNDVVWEVLSTRSRVTSEEIAHTAVQQAFEKAS